jgi:EAL domain-containing protein (putative c-di-GMP-specific phosphodiesterase class I)
MEAAGYGVVSPATFIPVAEESGQIERIGLFVLTEAARFSARAEATGRDDFCISINVSQAVQRPDFAAKMMRAVTEAGARPATSRSSLPSPDDGIDGRRQREARPTPPSGFLVSLDDFGKGIRRSPT